MIAHTFTAQEISTLHNAKCKLWSAVDRLTDIISDKQLKQLQDALDMIKDSMKSYYAAEEIEMEKHRVACAKIHEKYPEFISTWSLDHYDFDKVVTPCPVEIRYQGKSAKVKGNTWEDIWVAADEVMKLSGDFHHIFIEQFSPYVDKDGTYFFKMTTGS